MNSGPLLFLGLFLTMAGSFWGLILAPQLQIGGQQAIATEGPGQFYPGARPGQGRQGAEVYRSLGCVECHTRQVRGWGSDIERGWGKRISVARDYIHDYPVLLGSLRLGPDLANLGARMTDADWHLAHLYDPGLRVKGSPMPRYPFLFDKEPENARFPSPGALPMTVQENGRRYRLVPKPEARALVAYLISQRSDTPLFEAPVPLPPTNAPPAVSAVLGTNAPGTRADVVVTNSPAVQPDTNAPASNAVPSNPAAPAPAP
jgi:cytochrome c oxidase cbb3-type subunit 2